MSPIRRAALVILMVLGSGCMAPAPDKPDTGGTMEGVKPGYGFQAEVRFLLLETQFWVNATSKDWNYRRGAHCDEGSYSKDPPALNLTLRQYDVRNNGVLMMVTDARSIEESEGRISGMPGFGDDALYFDETDPDGFVVRAAFGGGDLFRIHTAGQAVGQVYVNDAPLGIGSNRTLRFDYNVTNNQGEVLEVVELVTIHDLGYVLANFYRINQICY